jgi:hypothetical protein
MAGLGLTIETYSPSFPDTWTDILHVGLGRGLHALSVVFRISHLVVFIGLSSDHHELSWREFASLVWFEATRGCCPVGNGGWKQRGETFAHLSEVPGIRSDKVAVDLGEIDRRWASMSPT